MPEAEERGLFPARAITVQQLSTFIYYSTAQLTIHVLLQISQLRFSIVHQSALAYTVE